LADASSAEPAMMAAVAAKAIIILRAILRPPACYRQDELFVGTAPLDPCASRAPRLRAKISTTESIGQDCDTLK
jgi:tRNA-dihydrouridine synthase